MPTYEYQCRSCHHLFELKQGFDAETVQVCPSCEGVAQRKFQAPTVIYKGSGFYTTDYARKGWTPPENGKDSSKQEAEPSTRDD